LLAHGLWFSPDTPASSTTTTGRYDIAEILLKVALTTINQIKSSYVHIANPYVDLEGPSNPSVQLYVISCYVIINIQYLISTN